LTAERPTTILHMLHGERITLRPVRAADLFNDGRNQDVLLYSILRDAPRPWHR